MEFTCILQTNTFLDGRYWNFNYNTVYGQSLLRREDFFFLINIKLFTKLRNFGHVTFQVKHVTLKVKA